jgi:Plasmid pRiA4b ORF-3-like protein
VGAARVRDAGVAAAAALQQLGAVRLGNGASAELTELAVWAMRRRLGAPASGEPVFQVKITLADVADPPVWRRLLVPAAIRLDRFHQVIQAVMGWEDYHLHVFSDGRPSTAGQTRSWGSGRAQGDPAGPGATRGWPGPLHLRLR